MPKLLERDIPLRLLLGNERLRVGVADTVDSEVADFVRELRSDKELLAERDLVLLPRLLLGDAESL